MNSRRSGVWIEIIFIELYKLFFFK
jgi:hypothetical protein